ncbi:MAG TPA: hypothetical protein VGV62_08030 [Xanthobacteraceae bacterium]|nr:hypothetical protein [Xanthobacteraceae bacterium]
MPEDQTEERPCLHCMMVELIDDFFAEYPAAGGEADAIDTDEVLTAIAKTVAELTSSQNSTIRQQVIEQLMRDIMEYDAEFRREDATGSVARH